MRVNNPYFFDTSTSFSTKIWRKKATLNSPMRPCLDSFDAESLLQKRVSLFTRPVTRANYFGQTKRKVRAIFMFESHARANNFYFRFSLKRLVKLYETRPLVSCGVVTNKFELRIVTLRLQVFVTIRLSSPQIFRALGVKIGFWNEYEQKNFELTVPHVCWLHRTTSAFALAFLHDNRAVQIILV